MASPLEAYLASANPTQREMNAILRAAAEEAERTIPKLLEKGNYSGKLRAAMLAMVLREIRVILGAAWGDLGSTLRDGVGRSYLAGADGPDVLFAQLDQATIRTLKTAFTNQAKQGIAAVLAKGANNIPLSSQVYKTQALSTGLVNRKVQQGMILGKSAKDIAKDVSGLIKPDVAGGVSYAAMRLARTELNNAFKTAQEERYKDEPWTIGMKWNLSKSHPERDICNEHAEADLHGLGAGVYPVGQRPKSHPNCLCYLTPEQMEEDEWMDRFIDGEFNDYLDEKVYTHNRGATPCP
jgi:hypothetical protein